jgi:hypothetical protein
MPVPSKSDVDLKELAVKWRARLPVWYGDGAEVDVSREVSGEVREANVSIKPGA